MTIAGQAAVIQRGTQKYIQTPAHGKPQLTITYTTAASQLSRDGRKERTAFFGVESTRTKNQLTVSEPHNTRRNVLVTLPSQTVTTNRLAVPMYGKEVKESPLETRP
jgi:hypothetical protein